MDKIDGGEASLKNIMSIATWFFALLTVFIMATCAAAGEVALPQGVTVHSDSWYKQFSGKLDLSNDFAGAAYQSVTSPDQVAGVGKQLFSAYYKDQELFNVGAFAGINREDNHGMAGPTAQVPGSLLDSALGTKWGQAWLPKLKTRMFFGYDITRPKAMHIQPSFIGVGAGYPFNPGF